MRKGLTIIVLLSLAASCRTTYYVYPGPIAPAYENPIPIQAGFLMKKELREEWFSKKEGTRRIDVPVGHVVLDFAKASLRNAFQRPETVERSDPSIPIPERDFYTIRYYDRRSENGILYKLNDIDYQINGDTVTCTLNITVEDAGAKELFTKNYTGSSDKAGTTVTSLPLPLFSKAKSHLEKNTATALGTVFQKLIQDTRRLVGKTIPPQKDQQPANTDDGPAPE